MVEKNVQKTYPILLFHPNIPKPLHGLAPRTILGQYWWKETKTKAKAELDNHCWTCGVHSSEAKYHQWLEAHECYSIDYSIGRVEYVGTCALCHSCHNYIHDGRMKMLSQKDLDWLTKEEEILKHGNKLIKKYLKSQKIKYTVGKESTNSVHLHELYPVKSNKISWSGNGANWDDYHLVIFGKRYERKHKTYEDWLNFYG